MVKQLAVAYQQTADGSSVRLVGRKAPSTTQIFLFITLQILNRNQFQISEDRIKSPEWKIGKKEHRR
jgi:hypothetical protein